jgi:hypothetical protein
MEDPDEQTTGTRDAHYNLISVLYHALHAAENCNTYALDAEAAGDKRLAVFFREAGITQSQLAERAKGMLGLFEVPSERGISPDEISGGIPPERLTENTSGGISPEDISGGIPPQSDDIQGGAVLPSGEGVLPATNVSRTPPGTHPSLHGGAKSPLSSGAFPDPDLVLPEEDVVASEDIPPDARQAATDRITPEDFDLTISALEGGVARLTIGQALAKIETWEQKLNAMGNPELESIAGNLGALRTLLSDDDIDVAVLGPLLTTLGEQVQGVASSEIGVQVADKLQRLSELLTREGRSLSG